MIERLVDHRALGAGRPPQMVAGAVALADREIDIFQHREPAEQLIDLEGAGDAAPRALGLRQRVMSSPSSSTWPAEARARR